MNNVTNESSVFSDLSITHKQPKKDASQELGQSAFLKLMVTQLENQNPTDPQDNTQFIAQLAQFSSVESLDKLNKNFNTFSNSFVANQALQASTLVGRSVTVPAEETELPAQGLVSLYSELPASSSTVNVNIYNDGGALVDSIPLGTMQQGEFNLRWNGRYAELDGKVLSWQSTHADGAAAGNYRFEVMAEIDGKEQALSTALSANVNSVTVGANGTLALNLAGVGTVSLADVKQFN